MTLVHIVGSGGLVSANTETETTEMRSISEGYPKIEFYAWLALVVVFALVIFTGAATAGLSLLAYAIGGGKNMANTPALLFYLAFALQLLVSLSLGFPLAMLPAAALAGRFFAVKNDDLPNGATTAHYFHKLWFQIARIACVLVALCLPLWLFVPGDSKVHTVVRLVIPMLSPALGSLICAWFFIPRNSARENKGAY